MQKLTARHGDREQAEVKSLYNYRWQKASKAFLVSNPFCIDCEAQGKLEPATETDHEIPHRGDLKLFWDKSNWRPRCKPCHSRKTAREDGGFGHPTPRGV
ncbi:MAG: HNH endonuclease [Gammaproteobacteria bacterium]